MTGYERRGGMWKIAWREKQRHFDCGGHCNPSFANSRWMAFRKRSFNHSLRDFASAGLVSGMCVRGVGELRGQNARSWIRSQARCRELRRDAEVPFTGNPPVGGTNSDQASMVMEDDPFSIDAMVLQAETSSGATN
jgi:hypothetical protein